MKVSDVKIDIEYRFENEIVKVIKRIKNSYVQKWYTGWGKRAKCTTYKVSKERTFLLNNGKECFARELSKIQTL